MNIGLIIAVVVAILASAARSKQLAQGGNEEAWPTNPYPSTEDPEIDNEPQVHRTLTPHQQRPSTSPRHGKKFGNAEAHQALTASDHPLWTTLERQRQHTLASEAAHQSPRKGTQQQPARSEEELQHELVRNFDPQKAIIYAEIMKPKFEDYE